MFIILFYSKIISMKKLTVNLITTKMRCYTRSLNRAFAFMCFNVCHIEREGLHTPLVTKI